MKSDWEIRKLSDVCEFSRGLTYKKTDEVESSNNIVLRANNVSSVSNQLDFAELKHIKNDFNIPENKLVKKDSILVCTASGSKSHLGKVAYIDCNYGYAFGGFMGLLQPKSNLMPIYLYYNLISDKYKRYIGNLTDGVNINNLRWDDLGKYEIYLPPLPEQKRIVSKLNDIFKDTEKAKEIAEKNLQNAKELFESVLDNLLDKNFIKGNESILEDVCEDIFAGGDVPRNSLSKEKTNELTIPIYTNGEKNNGLYGYTSKARVNKPSITVSARGTIGYSEIRHAPFYPAIRLIVITPDQNKLDINYLQLMISRIKFIHSGSSIPQLTVPMIKKYKIPLLPIKEQLRMVTKLTSLNNDINLLSKIMRQKIEFISDLNRSVLNKAFSGEL